MIIILYLIFLSHEVDIGGFSGFFFVWGRWITIVPSCLEAFFFLLNLLKFLKFSFDFINGQSFVMWPGLLHLKQIGLSLVTLLFLNLSCFKNLLNFLESITISSSSSSKSPYLKMYGRQVLSFWIEVVIHPSFYLWVALHMPLDYQ